MTLKINYGEIWLADFNPQSGTEPGKLRPVLIVQNQVLLDISHPSTIIVPLTTNLIEHAEPLRIRIDALLQLEKDSDLLIDQIRSIDNKRLVKGPLAQCSLQLMVEVQNAIREVLGLDQEKQVVLN
ncbi:MAG: type II toxin-antitoxin system PemK/MazF family toxin [Proteobacteria bacterium]|jgi:mRNA interferase MazF|nr:type II toxin-antitoxin system PemK/MazF family toxin [Pseudomonadota bacterium]